MNALLPSVLDIRFIGIRLPSSQGLDISLWDSNLCGPGSSSPPETMAIRSRLAMAASDSKLSQVLDDIFPGKQVLFPFLDTKERGKGEAVGVERYNVQHYGDQISDIVTSCYGMLDSLPKGGGIQSGQSGLHIFVTLWQVHTAFC